MTVYPAIFIQNKLTDLFVCQMHTYYFYSVNGYKYPVSNVVALCGICVG